MTSVFGNRKRVLSPGAAMRKETLMNIRLPKELRPLNDLLEIPKAFPAFKVRGAP